MKKNFSNFLTKMAMFELGCDPGLSKMFAHNDRSSK